MNKIEEKLTKIYIKLINAKFTGIKIVRLPRIGNIEVMTIKKKEWIFGAQAPAFLHTIIAEESLFRKSKNTQKFILAHEYMHTKRYFSCAILTIILLASGLMGVNSFLSFILPMILFFMSLSQKYIFYSLIGLFSLAIDTFFFVSASWIMEILADTDAIKALGRNSFLKLISERQRRNKHRKRKLSHRILYRLTHPPDNWILKLYDYFHG